MIQHAFARDSLEPKCTELKIMCKRQVDDDGDDGDDDGNDDDNDDDDDGGDDGDDGDDDDGDGDKIHV